MGYEHREEKNQHVLKSMQQALRDLRDYKPNNRSEMDRRYAIALTEMEKLVAYFDYWVVMCEDETP